MEIISKTFKSLGCIGIALLLVVLALICTTKDFIFLWILSNI